MELVYTEDALMMLGMVRSSRGCSSGSGGGVSARGVTLRLSIGELGSGFERFRGVDTTRLVREVLSIPKFAAAGFVTE